MVEHDFDDGAQQSPDFDGVVLFSATKARERESLGFAVTEWRKQHKAKRVTHITVRQSSDHEYHCVTILVWYKDFLGE